jgi:hypothetical protein
MLFLDSRELFVNGGHRHARQGLDHLPHPLRFGAGCVAIDENENAMWKGQFAISGMPRWARYRADQCSLFGNAQRLPVKAGEAGM